jgi:hypothetical protein
MEIFGGLGFMEDYAISRLHREALVTAIWEGSSNIQALDMLEAIAKKGAHEPFLDEFLPILSGIDSSASKRAADVMQEELAFMAGLSPPSAQWYAKDVLRKLADAAITGLLFRLAENAGERYTRLAELYAAHFILGEPYPDWVLQEKQIWDPFSES